MKRALSLMAACLLLFLLSACQSKTATETHWAAAKKAGSLEDYVKEQAENIDMEALKQEAQEGGLEQQFKATTLLCALVFWKNMVKKHFSFYFNMASCTSNNAVKANINNFFSYDRHISTCAQKYFMTVCSCSFYCFNNIVRWWKHFGN